MVIPDLNMSLLELLTHAVPFGQGFFYGKNRGVHAALAHFEPFFGGL